MKLRDVEIRIKVGESYLEEHDVRDADGESRKTCYIASETGKVRQICSQTDCSNERL